MTETFPDIRFTGTLRPAQDAAAKVMRAQLKRGERRLHIVAPPGSGKTVLGLYAWAHLVRRPAVVLSPTSAIQSQWSARLSLFDLAGHGHRVSDDPHAPGVFTSLTYQSISRPAQTGDLDDDAIETWCERLMDAGEATSLDEAIAWIEDLRIRNQPYFEARLAVYRKMVRDARALEGDVLGAVDENVRRAVAALREADVGMLILDECHHLLGHWGRVADAVADALDDPVVLGLTATPPDVRGRRREDVDRYARFFGPIDYETPTPALVRAGNLAPYQDLCLVVRPRAAELKYLAEADRSFRAIVRELERPRETTEATRVPPLAAWTARQLAERRIVDQPAANWTTFVRRDRALADHGRLYLYDRNHPWPDGVPEPPPLLLTDRPTRFDCLVTVLDRYVRHGLRRSTSTLDHALADETTGRLRLLGLQITETGVRPCAAPVTRVLAHSDAKTHALPDILAAEEAALGERLRGVVVCDYEKASSRTAETSVLDAEAGGAVAAFRTLLESDVGDRLDPILVTGATVLVDSDLAGTFLEEARTWLDTRGLAIELTATAEDGLHVIEGRGGDWRPRTYVALITELFQRGVTRCLVGTRGLLGEGWDAHRINVLIDLTTAATSMTVNQLRGRSFRIDPDDPKKLADNWDVICVAGEFAKGLDDYHRFTEKHEKLYGVTDDGVIERGVGHVHAAFTEMQPEDVEGLMSAINADMLARAQRRDDARTQWRIGTPFRGVESSAIEVGGAGPLRGVAAGGAPTLATVEDSLAYAVSRAVIEGLIDADRLEKRVKLEARVRDGGYVRLFLRQASEADSALFAESVAEVFGPLDRPRYVIPRFVTIEHDTWLSRLLPEVMGRYFRRERRRYAMLHAVPSALAKTKDLALTYQRAWNRRVSPGEAVYAHHGKGEEMVEQARQRGLTPRVRVHEKTMYE